MQITKHFSLQELTTTDKPEFKKVNFEEGKENLYQLIKLACFAEDVRSLIKSPMIITSAYRGPSLNKAIGGSPTSQHPKGEAIDFIPKTLEAKEAFDIIRHSSLNYGQIILEKRGLGLIIHLSQGFPYREKEKCLQALYSPKLGVYMPWQEDIKI